MPTKPKTKKYIEWPQRLDVAIKKKFGVKTKTFFDLIGSMRYITRPTGEKPLTNEIHAFIGKWMDENVPQSQDA